MTVMRRRLWITLALALGLTPIAAAHAQEETIEDERAMIEHAGEGVHAVADVTEAAPSGQAIGRVVLEERLPQEWWSNAADSLPLEPARQRARMPRRCRTRGGYRQFCAGARLVPEPTGPAAELAAWLSLGHRATALAVMHHPALEEWRAAAEGLDPEVRLTFPVPVGHMGRGFGFTRDAGLAHRRHDGVDIGAPEGSDVVAARGGLVVYADNGITGMGNVLIVLHSDGSSALYAHCHEIFVFAGQYVERGQRVAVVGMTGFARAPHLHFEWRTNGVVRDPARRFLPRDVPADAPEAPDAIAQASEPATPHEEEHAVVARGR